MTWSKTFQFINTAKASTATDESKVVAVVSSVNNTSLDMLINAGIMSGLGFFSTVAGLMASGLVTEPMNACFAAGISAGTQFFMSLAIQRGLKPKGSA